MGVHGGAVHLRSVHAGYFAQLYAPNKGLCNFTTVHESSTPCVQGPLADHRLNIYARAGLLAGQRPVLIRRPGPLSSCCGWAAAAAGLRLRLRLGCGCGCGCGWGCCRGYTFVCKVNPEAVSRLGHTASNDFRVHLKFLGFT
nr:MAG: hypothetical protein [Cressdnaviricota sp.]